MKKAAHHFTAADVLTHQRDRHGEVKCTCGLKPTASTGHKDTCPKSLVPLAESPAYQKALKTASKLPQPVKKSRPEREMGMILEAQKRASQIDDYKFQGMSLAYSEDPETGILLRYKCDYVVFQRIEDWPLLPMVGIKIIECKGHGKHAISAAAKLRFKGAKAAWPMFQFEMWQREQDGNWRRVL